MFNPREFIRRRTPWRAANRDENFICGDRLTAFDELDGMRIDKLRAVFKDMRQRVGDYEGDLKTLGAELQGDVDKMIKGCTMTGESHAVLHTFLGMYMPSVQRLAADGKEEEAVYLKSLLVKADRFFE